MSDFSPDMIKDKNREKKKNGGNSSNGFDSNGAGGKNMIENRTDQKKEASEKPPDVKEEPEETEIPENISSNNSPLDEKSPSAQQADKDVPSIISNPSSCKGVKSENGENADSSFRNDSCENVLPMNIPSEPSLHEGVQPLPSNVVNKQPVTMEAQYMQQQSQIFVFSTNLANKAAEAVLQGQYASIISYHCAQPRTKKYLEGTTQPNQILQNSCNTNLNVEQNSGKGPITSHPNLMNSHTNSLLNDAIMPLGELNQDIGITPPQPLAGVKVPDENLTPQQRQHREEQLATLRKMQQILFPEALSGPEEGSNSGAHVEENAMSETLDINKTPSSQSEWHKLQMQFYEDQKTRKRTNGPPPSYQQATRSASVPIALQSPNPSSPNNTTSNLSLPSPRTCSGINSPADKVARVPGPSPTMESPNAARNTNSNPPTPVSSHLSPKHKDKLNTTNEFSPSSTVSAQNSQQSPVDSIYCRPVQSIGQQKQTSNNSKEPNLMPVPSPQQIQYLSTFEGQELTIQKQPNTSLKDAAARKSPGLQQAALDSVMTNSANKNTDLSNKVAGSPAPSTPDITRNYPPDLNSGETTPDPTTNQPQRKIDVPFCNSPQTNERCHMNMQTAFMQKCPNFVDNTGPKCANSSEKEMSAGNFQCIGPDNVPLNPNRIIATTASKTSHFDPISSLAQMSQQLTNNVPNSPVNQQSMMQNMHQNMPPFSSPNSNQHLLMSDIHHIPNTPPDHRMQNQMQPHFNTNRPQCNNTVSPGMSVSPKMMQGYGPQRPIPRGIGYNGASIQVKPNAPNTIQYLPSRPQTSSVPRGPPSLEFLQRFSNPLSNLDSKLPSHNLQYYPSSYPQNNMNDMGMCSPHGSIRGPIRAPNPGMMRLQSPQMGFNNAENFQNSNCQLFGASPKGSTLGLAPDASQPLPPSMGQNNNFKNSTFIGPTTADPNYAQQFHNFQQQLYATNTRGQLTSQNMGANQHYFIPK
ncbi:protein BCL9 homolog [Halyomorpha halys]|uniref:protein BCL9 homolog n=1 Tax=Halyomorpha halys TaxID=286706 RepID=UPI0006D4F5FC|nr:protein BCL9 homolog isoform X2 [Halyomorpha halys]